MHGDGIEIVPPYPITENVPPRASIAAGRVVRLVRPDEVEDELRAATARQVSHGVGRSVPVDHLVGAELAGEPPPPLVGVDRDDRARPELAEELERDVPDAADADHDGGRAGNGEMRERAAPRGRR